MIAASVSAQVGYECVEWLMRCVQLCVITGRSPHPAESHLVVMVLLHYCVLNAHIFYSKLWYYINIQWVFPHSTSALENEQKPSTHITHLKWTVTPQRKAQNVKKIHWFIIHMPDWDFEPNTLSSRGKPAPENTTCAPAPFSTTITDGTYSKRNPGVTLYLWMSLADSAKAKKKIRICRHSDFHVDRI